MDKEECTKHVPAFDEEEARKLLEGWTPKSDVDFIMGNPAAREIRKRWPRFEGTCGCGFSGISYASTSHYRMGDW